MECAVLKPLRELLCFTALLTLGACDRPQVDRPYQEAAARFLSFSYSGNDEIFDRPLTEGYYRNPILAGFYPDPSVVRVGSSFYMVNSTFGFYPGVPLHKSEDLVNWRQIGNVISRPDMMPFDGLHLGQNGIYAPTIEYHEGTFYVATTCVGCGGNFVVTTADPTGSWSDPVWLPHVQGIDPSLFFDDDGKMYVVHHGNPDEKLYDAHTALFIMELDPETFSPLSDDVMIVDGAVEQPWNTEYIEGPHLYKVEGRYVLSAPGGGTGYYHGQLAYRADDPFGPYVPFDANPILTQFGLADDRPDAVTATGHADLVEDGSGNWWAVFLGTRVYDLDVPPQDPGRFHTGRETFLLPVEWRDGWPIILEPGLPVPLQAARPNLPIGRAPNDPTTGNFAFSEEFREPALGPQWLFIRTPKEEWWSVGEGSLTLKSREEAIGEGGQPSFIGRRIQHMTATIEAELLYQPASSADEAGIAAIQNSAHYYTFGIGRTGDGESVVRVRRRDGGDMGEAGIILAEEPIALNGGSVKLQVNIDKGNISFSISQDGAAFAPVLSNADSAVLTTARAGGFVGAVIGMYAHTGSER